jgi:hypothetical protein
VPDVDLLSYDTTPVADVTLVAPVVRNRTLDNDIPFIGARTTIAGDDTKDSVNGGGGGGASLML